MEFNETNFGIAGGCRDIYTNFTKPDGSYRGAIVERVCGNDTMVCESWMLLPGENLWSVGVRTALYILGMFYTFIGITIASDIFMMSIEVITSRKRTIAIWDEEKQERVERDVLVWNETVSNLTLMALGSSAPEILIAVVEMLSNIPFSVEAAEQLAEKDGLGVFTIMGSASYNLLMISAICIVAPNLPHSKKVSQFSVFLVTSAWSLWAYIWMLLVVRVISPGQVEIWEAWVTLLGFPALALSAYAQDNGWWISRCRRKPPVLDDEDVRPTNHSNNVRVLTRDHHPHGLMHGPSKELKLIENEHHLKEIRRSNPNLTDLDEEVGVTYEFAHPGVRSFIGGKPVKTASNANLSRSDLFKKSEPMTRNERANALLPIQPNEDHLLGKFSFSASSFSVLESEGTIEVEVRFGRPQDSTKHVPNGSAVNGQPKNGVNGKIAPGKGEGAVTVCWETRDGSAKAGTDFTYSSGSITFEANECKKMISIPIVNDDMFEADNDFYIILKNPSAVGSTGTVELGDPSICRITIIDDDEPGEFLFEKAHYFASKGSVTVTVIRINGCDSDVTLEYSTMDGTARGGTDLEESHYISQAGTLEFKHGESSKNIIIPCMDHKSIFDDNGDQQLNFIIVIRNPSGGGTIGQHSAAVINFDNDNILKDGLGDRLAEVLEDDEPPITYCEQFSSAVLLVPDNDEELKWYNYLFHFLSMPWKVVCAFIPPRSFLGAYPSFVFSILWIAGMSAIVEQLAKLLGCVVNLRTAVTGCTLVALGTSVPDTFASRTAAKQDEFADAAIGNITGSNSVNVFLGLGLPWVFSSMWYKLYLKTEYRVATGNLAQAVIMFCVVGSICLGILFGRRMLAGGELGGNKKVAWTSALVLFLLWVLFLTMIVLISYDIIDWDI